MIDVNKEIKSAMLDKDSVRLASLRALKSAFIIAETEKGSRDLSDEKKLKIIQKQVKQRKEASNIYNEQGRPDLAREELEQMEVLAGFLPAPISDEELTNFLTQIILDCDASSITDMGKVMGLASKKLSGKADGKQISEKVRELLK